MNAHTHWLGGLAAAGVALSLGAAHPVTLVVASGLGGLVPDWDHPGSMVGRWVPWPALTQSRGPQVPPRVGRRGWPHPIWHRQQAHSLVGVAIASGVLTLLAAALWHGLRPVGPALFAGLTFPAPWIFGGLWLGCLSHLALDGFNQTPQWWLWPFTRHGFRWPWHAPVRQIDALASLVLTVGLVLLAWHLGRLPLRQWLSSAE